MQIGVLIPENSCNLPEMLSNAAAWGAEGVQFYVRNPHYDLLRASADDLNKIRTLLNDLNLALPAICGELGGGGVQVQAENPQKIREFCKVIDIARRLETPVVSAHIGVIPADEHNPVYPVMLEAVTAIGRYAAARNITIAIETGPEPPAVLRKFIEQTDGGVGVNLDPANLVMVQNIDAVSAVKELKDHIVHTHAKDGIHLQSCDPERVYRAFAEGGFARLVAETGELFREVPLGAGSVNFPAYLNALHEIGYTGFLTIEREAGNDISGNIRTAIEFLRQQLNNNFPARAGINQQ